MKHYIERNCLPENDQDGKISGTVRMVLEKTAVEAFPQFLNRRGLDLVRARTTLLQINVGLVCNLTCRHCHLEALIALTVAHAIKCPYCIDAYTQTCLEKGSNLGEMTEAVHVAAAIRGGAALMHGIQMRNVAQKISM